MALLAGCGGGTLKDVNLGPVAHGTAAGGTASHGKASRGAESPLAVRAIRLAARQARRVNSYEVTLNTRVTGLAAGTAAVDSTSGVLQIRLKPSLLANFTMNISVAGKVLPVREIVTAHALYLKLPEISAEIGKPWIKISNAGMRQRTGTTISQLLQETENSDPLAQTAMLTASKDLRQAGTQLINGVPVTHYTGSYSVAAALAEVPPSLRGPAESVLTTMGVRTVHFSAWIDRHHQVRKLITVEAGNGTRITSRTEIVAINQPVHVQLPPASQVATGPAGPSMLG